MHCLFAKSFWYFDGGCIPNSAGLHQRRPRHYLSYKQRTSIFPFSFVLCLVATRSISQEAPSVHPGQLLGPLFPSFNNWFCRLCSFHPPRRDVIGLKVTVLLWLGFVVTNTVWAACKSECEPSHTSVSSTTEDWEPMPLHQPLRHKDDSSDWSQF